MFWGLVLEPGKRYTQKVEQSFHLSQAALDVTSGDSETVQLILQYDGCDFVLATLARKCNIFQVPLDLNFQIGDQVSFRTVGKAKVHLTGYHVPEEDLEGMLNSEDNEEMEEDMEDSDVSPQRGKRKKNMTDNSMKMEKKLKMESDSDDEEDEDDDEEDNLDSSDDESDEPTLGDSTIMDLMAGDDSDADLDEDDDSDEEEDDKKRVKQLIPSPKTNGVGSIKKEKKSALNASGSLKKGGETPTKEVKQEGATKSPKSPGQKKVLEGGVVIEEIKPGDGPVAKQGKMVQVYYSGRLKSNNKLFDESNHGAGFKFRLGRGEVIKGWDIGVSGMKVGGKRRIVIPPALAYGAKGAAPVIPPNSTLVFEVELKGVN